MNIYTLIEPLGITTYILLVLTITSGLRRWKLKYHKIFAFSAITAATCHVVLVISAH